MTRREKLLNGYDLGGSRGIEIGPLTSPLVSKEESEVYYVDHADRETLQLKYAHDPNVDIQKIVAVDAVWGDQTLRQCFPDIGSFDYVIASHVVEHVPDFLGWLGEIADVLRPGGRLILAVPDKRFTFDYLRQPTRVSEIVDAYLRRNRRPMPAQLFDYNANAVEVDMVATWEGRLDPGSLKHYVDLRYALDRSVESIRDGKYIDAHCWVFTASSLIDNLLELVELDLLPYSCHYLSGPERNTNEIALVLERWRDGSPAEKDRARLSFLSHAHDLEEVNSAQTEHGGRSPVINEQLERANGEIAKLRKQVCILEAQMTSILGSRSFQFTRPLRKVRALASSLLAAKTTDDAANKGRNS